MDRRQLKKCRKRLQNRWPLVGTWLKRKAARRLADDHSAEAVPLLVEALASGDKQVQAMADAVLRQVTDWQSVNALCRVAMGNPAGAATRLCLETGKQPSDANERMQFLVKALASTDRQIRAMAEAALRQLTDREEINALCRLAMENPGGAATRLCMKTGKHPSDPQERAQFLVKALASPHKPIQAMADAALLGLTDREAVNALCHLAMEDPNGAAAQLCVKSGKRPSDPEECALFLVVTRQLEAYFQEDFEFQNLRPAYERAGKMVQKHLRDVVRATGDRRLIGFFGRRKPLTECSDAEIRLAIESALRHLDWPKLFDAFLVMPLKYGFPLLENFRNSGWEPEKEDLRSQYRGVLGKGAGPWDPTVPRWPPPPSTLFDKWLAEGRTWDLSRHSEAKLIELLRNAAPREGVKFVAALAATAALGNTAASIVQASPHWLVRLAGYATGLCAFDPTRDEVKDDNHWVRELVGAVSVLEFWPTTANPEDLEKLSASPGEAFTGKLGGVQRVLRLLLAYRVTTPELTEVVYEAGEFAGEFEEAK